MFRILKTAEYIEWFNNQSNKDKGHIKARILRISEHGHFGITKKIDENLAELKWRNGRRIYFTFFVTKNEKTIILLLGGNKNHQSKDIKKAKALINRIREEN